MKIITPYRLLVFTSLMLAFISMLFSGETVDIHLHDTYYIISIAQIFKVLSFLLLLLWLLYKLTSKLLLSRLLSRAHIILTIITLVLITVIPFWYGMIYTRGKVAGRLNYEQFNIANSAITLLILVLVAEQIIFFTNLFGGLLKKIKKRHSAFGNRQS